MDELTRVYQAALAAMERREPCAIATVVETTGSIPRSVGAKMLVYADASIVGTVGGGKFESLVIADAVEVIRSGVCKFETYPLHEGAAKSFGAICGGEVRVFIEAQKARESLTLVGAGHCARALATLALECGMRVTVVDDRTELLEGFPASRIVSDGAPSEHIARTTWETGDALALVSRSFQIDRDALAAALENPGYGYIGMIGSRKKVRQVFSELESQGVQREALAGVHAPIGLDIGADSPMEIAISVLAEVLSTLRGATGRRLSETV